MKKIFLLAILTTVMLSADAQSFTREGEQLFANYNLPSLHAFSVARTMPSNHMLCDGSPGCVRNKKYKRYDFNVNGTALYRKSQRYNSDWYKSPVYYASNDQLYFDTENLKDHNYAPAFYENGDLYHVTAPDKDQPNVDRLIINDKEGKRLVDLSKQQGGYDDWYQNNQEYGNVSFTVFEKDGISALAVSPSYYPVGKAGDSYYGFLDIGEYFSKMQDANFVGYMLPAKEDYGNGTVAFMEDYPNKKFYWVVIVDGIIRFKQEATEAERPDILALKKNSNLKMINISDYSSLPVDFKKHFYSDPNSGFIGYNHLFYGQPLVEITSKNIKTLSGYGVNLTYKDIKAPSDQVYLEVGQFKNGKLNGVGYRSKMVYNAIAQKRSGNNNDYQILKDKVTVTVEYGLFADGAPVNTKKFAANNVAVGSNYWDGQTIPGLNYANKAMPSEVRIINGATQNIKAMKPGDRLYVSSVKRILKVKEVNLATGEIKTESDEPNVLAVFSKDTEEKLYVNRNVNSTSRESCPKEVKIPHYKMVKKFAYYVPAKVTSNSYTVKGVYYDKKVTQTSTTPSRTEYKDVQEIDHYTTETCAVCGGTGYLEQSKMMNVWQELKF